MKKRKLLLTSLKILVVMVALFAVRGTTPVFADIWQDILNQSFNSCGSNKPYCYNEKVLVWVYSKFTSGKTIKLSSALGPFSASGYGYPQGGITSSIDCSSVDGAEGAYILAETWFKSKTSKLSGYFYPIVGGQTKGSFANFESRYLDTERAKNDIFEYPLGSVPLGGIAGYNYPYWGSGDDETKLFYGNDTNSYVETNLSYVFSQYEKWDNTGNAKNNWEIGNFNYFCGVDKQVIYSSKSNVYNPASKVTVTSDYVDGQTNEKLNLSTLPGQEVTVYFNHYLRGSSNVSGNTNWKVERTMSISGNTNGAVPSFTDLTNGGTSTDFKTLNSPVTGKLETADTNEHSVPNSATNRQVKITIPSTDKEVDYTITICEYISYQKENRKTANYDGGTHVCAAIRVTYSPPAPDPGGGGVTCPLSYFSAPSPGTKDSGTTKTASGIISNVFTSYSEYIYVKPTDQVSWAHCYNPEAQAVRYTNEYHYHPKPSCDGPSCSSSSDVGPQDDVLSSQNKATISTSNSNSFTPSVSFSVSSNGSFSVSGSSINGSLGDSSAAVIYSSIQPPSYKVKTGYAGTTSTQAISTDIGTNSVNGCSSWTWTYSYWCEDCCSKKVCTESTGEDGKTVKDCTWESYSCYKTGRGYGEHTGYGTFYSKSSTTSWSESSKASFYIPYNFTTSVSTDISQSSTDHANDEIVLAGESITINAEVGILPRNNATTQGTYATEPPYDTRVEIVTFYLTAYQSIPSGSNSVATDSVCSFYNGRGVKQCERVKNYSSRSQWMGSTPSLNNGSIYSLGVSTKAYNIPAGYRICSAVGINHTNSGNDTNNNGAGTVSSNWNISAPTCRSVAKNPSSQIWGGSFFTNGSVKTSSTTKSALGTTVGSWTEYALIAGGTSSSIQGMASGAYLGYSKSYSVNSNQGGSANSKFYTRTALAIANNNCINNSGCNKINSSGIIQNSTIANRLITRYVAPASEVGVITADSINLSARNSYEVYNGYRLTHTRKNLTIYGSASLTAGVTHIIYVENGDLTIGSNLVYDETNGGSKYNSISQIPQFVIIVKNGSIKIQPHVTRIDAWLIAENGNIDTCYGTQIGVNLNATNCGSKLVVNGPIIAKSILPKRAFGAGAQDSNGLGGVSFNDQYNVTSAEVFNMSLSAYLWAYAQALDSPQAYTVYTRTLAPRL